MVQGTGQAVEARIYFTNRTRSGRATGSARQHVIT